MLAAEDGTVSAQPPIVIGDDGLPHCGWCLNEHVLCGPHRIAVTAALNGLKTPNLLGRSEHDLRYVIRRPWLSVAKA